MTNRESMSDISRLPAQLLRGDVVCFGFLTHCLLLMVDQLPPQNGGAPVLDSVEIVGDDAAIAAKHTDPMGRSDAAHHLTNGR